MPVKDQNFLSSPALNSGRPRPHKSYGLIRRVVAEEIAERTATVYDHCLAEGRRCKKRQRRDQDCLHVVSFCIIRLITLRRPVAALHAGCGVFFGRKGASKSQPPLPTSLPG